jgi:hypothetical protein
MERLQALQSGVAVAVNSTQDSAIPLQCASWFANLSICSGLVRAPAQKGDSPLVNSLPFDELLRSVRFGLVHLASSTNMQLICLFAWAWLP